MAEIMESKILKASEKYLQNSVVTDAVLGLSLVGVELDNKEVGLSYTLRDSLPVGCSLFPFHKNLLGRPALEVATECFAQKDALSKSVAMAILNAANSRANLPDATTKEEPFALTPNKTDTLGMVGYVMPVEKLLSPQVGKTYIFDKGISELGSTKKGLQPLTSMDKQEEILSQCSLVFLSGTTLLNNTFETLISYCKNAREVVMLGSSTPMYPEAFKDTPVTVLAGSHWDYKGKITLFKRLSLAAGIMGVEEFMLKRCVKVK